MVDPAVNAGIQGTWWTNWNPWSGSKPCGLARSQIAIASDGTVAGTAVQRIRPCARDGNARMTAIPISGMKIIRLNVSVISVPSSRSRRRGPRPVEEHAPEHADDDDVEVGRD